MAGKKGRSGGFREGSGKGGAKEGAGRPVKRIHLDDTSSRELRTMVRDRCEVKRTTEDDFVIDLIHEKWRSRKMFRYFVRVGDSHHVIECVGTGFDSQIVKRASPPIMSVDEKLQAFMGVFDSDAKRVQQFNDNPARITIYQIETNGVRFIYQDGEYYQVALDDNASDGMLCKKLDDIQEEPPPFLLEQVDACQIHKIPFGGEEFEDWGKLVARQCLMA